MANKPSSSGIFHTAQLHPLPPVSPHLLPALSSHSLVQPLRCLLQLFALLCWNILLLFPVFPGDVG